VTRTKMVIGRACESCKRIMDAFRTLQGNLKKKCHLDERGVNGRIILQ